MSNRKIINAAATGGIGYYPVGNPTDAYYDNVSLLLNGDVEVDSNFANVSLLLDGNTLTDKSNNKATITNTGSVTVSSTVKKFGTGSMAFSGSNYLTSASNQNIQFGTGDFTVEFWINASASGSYNQVIGTLLSGTEDGTWRIGNRFASSNIVYFARGTGISYDQVQYSINVNDGSWHHLACVRQSGVIYMYVDGIAQTASAGSASISGTCTSSNALYAGYNTRDSSYLTGYIDDLRITKGIARYTSSFTPPVKALPTHEILDSSVYRLPVTAVGNARIDATTKKFGTGAMYFDGSGDYLTLPNSSGLLFGTDNFTIEFWFRQSTAVSAAAIFCNSTNSSVFNANWFYIHANHPTYPNKFCASAYNIASSVPFIAGTTDIVNDNWYHVALVRSSTAFSLYVNGALEGTATSSASIDGNTVYSKYVGGAGDGGLIVNGYIDDLRITKGIARYTANFPPGPTASLPTIPPTISADPWWGNVSLLLDGNTTDAYDPYWQNVSLMLTGDDFIDWSNQHNAITNNGTVTLSTAIKKFNASSLSFNGSSQYLTIPTSSNFSFGTGNFTIEFWVRFTTVATDQQVVSFYSNSSTSRTIALYTATNGTLNYYLSNNGSSWDIASGVLIGNISTSTWYHVALVRNDNTFTPYLNAIGGTTTTSALSINGTTSPVYIGSSFLPSSYFSGQIADFRITKGIARTITVPTAALPAYKIQDRTQNNLTVTPYGNVQLSTDVMKNGTGSMFFDGTGDYLSLSTTEIIGNSNYTIEFWLNIANSAGCGMILGTQLCHWQLGYDSNGYYLAYFNMSADYNANQVSSVRGVYGSWTHIAASRIGNTTSVYYNGVYGGGWSETLPGVSGGASQIGHSPRYSGNYLTGYIDDLRITNGYARYTQNFTPPSQSFATQYISTGYDANYADVSLLLNGNGTNGSQVFTDLSGTPKTITAYGNIQISTAVKKYGTGAMYFDGTGDYLSVPSAGNVGTSDLTVEAWVNLGTSPGGWGHPLIDTRASNGASTGFAVQIESNGTFGIYTGGGYAGSTATGIFTFNTWHHIAIVRNNSTWKCFIDGVQILTFTNSNNFTDTTCLIGTNKPQNGTLQGYIDDLRITKGIARYTASFTPPTYQLPTDTTGTVIDPLRASTSLLLRGNGTNGSTSFTDESPNGLTVTNNGSVTVNTTTKKYGTGSIYSDGIGTNYLTIQNGSHFAFGTGDFTIELWVYIVSAKLSVLFDTRNSGDAGAIVFLTDTSNKLWLFLNGVTLAASTNAITSATWTHVAVSRYAGTVSTYINGVSGFSATNNTNLTGTGGWIGAIQNVPSDTNYRINGYIDDLRITKGYARYTANFTPPTYEDPIVTGTVYDYNYPQVSLLLNGDGTNGSTVFKDLSSSPKTITNTGSVAVNTTTKKFGTGSMAFSGSNYLTIPSTSTGFSGDFTVEGWGYYSNSSGYATLFDARNAASSYAGILLYIIPSTSINVTVNVSTVIITGTQPAANTWFHFALSRAGSSIYLFINGTQIGSTASNSTSFPANTLYLGAFCDPTANLNGYIDDFRITKGLARYTQNFTPPTAPLPTSYS